MLVSLWFSLLYPQGVWRMLSLAPQTKKREREALNSRKRERKNRAKNNNQIVISLNIMFTGGGRLHSLQKKEKRKRKK